MNTAHQSRKGNAVVVARVSRRLSVSLAVALALLQFAVTVTAAPAFASPAFQKQWQPIEVVKPNFGGLNLFDVPGPPGQQEPYREAPGGTRLVQYFDKARMELPVPASGRVT